MTFVRTKEDFVCAQCGTSVKGDGYTNHCPNCLWSKHVDIDPGDRAAECGGMMGPIGLNIKGDEYRIVHKCTRCGFTRTTKSVPQDDREALVRISSKVL